MSNIEDFVIEYGVLTKYDGPGGDVVIPEGVTEIGKYAFCNCSTLTSVVIPNSVTKIGFSSFAICKNITSIYIPDSVTKIESFAFEHCERLSSLTISPNVKIIERGAFGQCDGLQQVVIPEGVSIIDNEVFFECRNLKTVFLPVSVKEILWGAFRECRNLEGVHTDASELDIKSDTFENSPKAYLVAPNLKLTSIADTTMRYRTAAYFCKRILAGENLPSETVAYYKKYVKSQRKKMYDIALKDEEFLQYMIAESVIPKSDISEVVDRADKLSPAAKAALLAYQDQIFPTTARIKKEDQNLEAALTGILSVADAKKIWTFEVLENGVCITGYKGNEKDVIVPNGIGKNTVTTIGEFAFSPDAPRVLKAVKENRSKIETVTVPSGILGIGAHAFANCKSLKAVNLPASVAEIEEAAFENCKELKEIQLPDMLSSIGNTAFQNCAAIKTLTLPEDLHTIGIAVFLGCKALKTLNISAENKFLHQENGILYSNDGPSVICCLQNTAGHISIADGTVCIAAQAFENCRSITDVVIPNSVSEIGERAFWGCSKLEHIRLPEGLKEIPTYLLSGCNSLREIQIPESVTDIGAGAFRSCGSVQSVRIPEKVHVLPYQSFENCKGMTDLFLSGDIERFGIDMSDMIARIGEENLNPEQIYRYTHNDFSMDYGSEHTNGYIEVFSKCNAFTIHGPAGGHAEEFAKKNNIPFVAE